MDNEQDLKKRWKVWNEARSRQQTKKKLNVEEGMQNYATSLIERMQDPMKKHEVRVNREIGNEIQTNICSICWQLMIPPLHQPMMLFSCGHNICRDCLFIDAQKRRQKYQLKINKCSICRSVIKSYALNRNLMTLICMYTNNKELLEKQLAKENQEIQSKNQDIDKLRIRCQILENQKKQLKNYYKQFIKQQKQLNQALQILYKEKKRNIKEMQELENQQKLINQHIKDKEELMQLSHKKINNLQQKQNIIEKTLTPLIREKQKLEFLQIAKLQNNEQQFNE